MSNSTQLGTILLIILGAILVISSLLEQTRKEEEKLKKEQKDRKGIFIAVGLLALIVFLLSYSK